MALELETIRQLETERTKIQQQISELGNQIHALEEHLDAINMLLNQNRGNSGGGKSLKAVLKGLDTFRDQVAATVMYCFVALERKVRPVEVAAEMEKTGLFSKENLKGKVATEMYKLSQMPDMLVAENGLYAPHPKLTGK